MLLPLVAVLIAALMVGVRVPSATASTTAAVSSCQPSDPSCVEPSDIYLVDASPGDPTYTPTADQLVGLRGLEAIAVDTVIARHGLAPTDDERVRMRLWDRPELRLELISLILLAANKAPADRTSDDNEALSWFADVQKRRDIAVAEAAKAEYEKFAGATAYQGGAYPQNSCTYTPPAPYASEYPGDSPRWIACTGGQVGPLDQGPKIPSADDFTRWGSADVAGQEFGSDSAYLNSLLSIYGVGLLSAASILGPAVATVAALPSETTAALLAAISPYVENAATTAVVSSAQQSFVAASAIEEAVSAGTEVVIPAWTVSLTLSTVFAVAAVVIVALTILITSIIGAVDASNVGTTLIDNLANAQVTAVDAPTALAATGGTALLLLAVEHLTSSSDLASVVDTDQYTPSGGATILQVSGASGAPPGPQRTQRLRYLADGGNNTIRTGDSSFTGGWWVDNQTDPTKRLAPSQTLEMYLQDPSPTNSGGVLTNRPVFDDAALVTTVEQDGRRRFLVTAPDVLRTKPMGSACADLQVDGCWITDTLLVPDPVHGVQTVSMLDNTVAPFTIAAPNNIQQNAPVTFQALDGSLAPYTTDADGDAVSVTWTTTQCPSFFDCAAAVTGPTPSFTFPDPGDYTVQATATDAFGLTTTQSVSFTVANSPPTLALDSTTVAGTRAGPVTIAGHAPDGPLNTVSVLIDWGDGTPKTAVNTRGILHFVASHTYAQTGTYTAAVSANDGTLSTPLQTVMVTIADSAPQVTLTDSSKSPASWANLQPGSQISESGTVVDPDLGQPVTLKATWYDGAVDTINIPRGNGLASQSFTLTHTVRASTNGIVFAPGGGLVRVTATDDSGLSNSAQGSPGSVVDIPPVLAGVQASPGLVGQQTTIVGNVSDANGDSPILGVLWGDGTDDPSQIFGQPVSPAADGSFQATHDYSATGTYTITIIASDPALGATVVRKTLNVYIFDQTNVVNSVSWLHPPVVGQTATLSFDISAPESGAIVISWAPASQEGGDQLVQFDAGDHVINVDHVFAHPWPAGFVNAYVTVGLYGATQEYDSPDPVIDNPAPTLPDLPALTGNPGTPVSLTLNYNDLGADTDTATIDWGDGSTPDTTTLSEDTAQQTVAHTYAAAGVYHPSVTITDLVNNTVTKSTQAVIGTIAPVLGALTVRAAPEGSATTVSATAIDPVGGPAQLKVNWGDGTSTMTDPAVSTGAQTASHTYADNGVYTLAVVALNAAGQASHGRGGTAKVFNAPPKLTVSAPASVNEGGELSLTATVADPGSLDTGTVAVDWGDGTSTVGLPWTASARTLTATHVYGDDDPSGTSFDRKRIVVTAQDNDGGAGRGVAQVIVRNVPPTAAVVLHDAAGRLLGSSATVSAGSVLDAVVQVSDPGTSDVETVALAWGDATTSTVTAVNGIANVTHRYSTTGTDRFGVTVTDDDLGMTRVPTRTINVMSPSVLAKNLASNLRSLVRATMPSAVATALKAAAALLTGPLAVGQPDVLDDLAAGSTTAAVGLVEQAGTQVQVALAAGAPAAAQQRAIDLALLARALVQTAIGAADPAAQATIDATDALGSADQALNSGDLPTAYTFDGRALTLLAAP